MKKEKNHEVFFKDLHDEVLNYIDETDKDYTRAQWALKHDLSLFDFDEWVHVCHLLDEDVPFDDIHAMNEFFEEWNDLPERKGKPWCDWDWMAYESEDDKKDLHNIWQYCTKRMYKLRVSFIVSKQGGFRERKVLSEQHEIVRGATWNDEHKVVEILSCIPEADGYRSGFQVDLVTESICG